MIEIMFCLIMNKKKIKNNNLEDFLIDNFEISIKEKL